MKKQPTKNKTDINIVGILELFVCASIGFMAFIVITGLEDPISKLLTVPALVWAAVKLVTKFTK